MNAYMIALDEPYYGFAGVWVVAAKSDKEAEDFIIKEFKVKSSLIINLGILSNVTVNPDITEPTLLSE